MSQNEQFLLTGFRVLDVCNENGMFGGKLLADLGAEVIKVEPPGGDQARNIGPFFDNNSDLEKSLFWLAYNVNKRGITLDIETKEGQDIFKKLAGKVDCVIESFAPGHMDKLGLGYSDLYKSNPGLIMTSITPFGQTGQYKDYEACDLVIQAMSGWLCGDPDRAPVRWGGEQSFALPGYVAISATVMALYAREMTGEGQHVDVSMRECMCWAGTGPWQSLFWEFQKENRKREGNLSTRGVVTIRSLFPCADGYISWRIWTGAMGRLTRRVVDWMNELGQAGELNDVDWGQISVLTAKQEDWERYEQAFTDFYLKYTKKEIYDAAAKYDFIAVPVQGAKEIVENPQLAFRQYFVPLEHPELGTSIRYPGNWFRSTLDVKMIRHRAPLIGEHNEEILAQELGLSQAKLKQLKEARVI